MNKTSFFDRLSRGPLMGDGAMGTMLLSSAPAEVDCLEALNLEAPEQVRRVHEEYRNVGAEILQTNSFGANAARLAACGRDKQVEELNRAAVEIAREAAGPHVWVAGSVGPTGLTATDAREFSDIFRAQIAALADSGADMVLLETFSNLAELESAIGAAREVVGRRLPVGAQMTLGRGGTLRDGTPPEAAARAAVEAGADVVGLNCCDGPQSVWDPLRRLLAEGAAPIIVQPSAGVPRLQEGVKKHPCGPEEFGQWAERFYDAGAAIVGGCCGTTPEYIRRVREARGRPKTETSPGAGVAGVEKC